MPHAVNRRLRGKQPPPLHEFVESAQAILLPEGKSEEVQASEGKAEDVPTEIMSPLGICKQSFPPRMRKRTGGKGLDADSPIPKRQHLSVQALETAAAEDPPAFKTYVPDCESDLRAGDTSQETGLEQTSCSSTAQHPSTAPPAEAPSAKPADAKAITEPLAARAAAKQVEPPRAARRPASADAVRTMLPGILDSLTAFAKGQCIPEGVVQNVINSLAPLSSKPHADVTANQQTRAVIRSALDTLAAHSHEDSPITDVVPEVLASIGALAAPLMQSGTTRPQAMLSFSHLSDSAAEVGSVAVGQGHHKDCHSASTGGALPHSAGKDTCSLEKKPPTADSIYTCGGNAATPSAGEIVAVVPDSKNEEQIASVEHGSIAEACHEDSNLVSIVPSEPTFPFERKDFVEDLDVWIQRSLNNLQ